MSAPPLRSYRFATADHWNRCVVDRLDVNTAGSLVPAMTFGSSPVHEDGRGPVSVVAVDRHLTPLWRLGSTLLRRESGAVEGPFEIEGALAVSRRWIADRDWIWAFVAGSTVVQRYERDSLQHDRAIDASLVILDIASDGREGVWLLLQAEDDVRRLRHIDCAGRRRRDHRVPCEARQAIQVGTVKGGARLMLLAEGGKSVAILDAATGLCLRVVSLGASDPCWWAMELSTDTAARVGLWGSRAGEVLGGSLLVLNASGDAVDGPLPCLPAHRASDVRIAMARNSVWLGAPDGLWRLDAGQAGAHHATGTLLTPALISPDSDPIRGWLRAEVTTDLPRGAVLEADFATTDDPRVAQEAARIARDPSMGGDVKQRSIWQLLDTRPGRRFVFKGPPVEGVPFSIPLFESKDRWLWLRLKLVTPPGTMPSSLEALRVLYPDISIAQHLPAIFFNPENDPRGFLRGLVGVMEATTQQIDERIASIGPAIDPRTAPDGWLDYLGRWLDLPWDDGLPVEVKRALLRDAAALLDLRGTRAGLQRLLRCFLGDHASVRITDFTVDHPPMRIGGAGKRGAPLPMLLAGSSPRLAILGVKAVVGTARLTCRPAEVNPLDDIVPTLGIRIEASRARQRALEPLLARVARQYIPAAVKLTVRWRIGSATQDDDGLVLDARGPGRVGVDAEIGRSILRGRGAGRLDDAGLEMGFPIR